MSSMNFLYIFELGAIIFFLELNCINKTIKVTEKSCKIILEMINIKLEAQPGIAVSVMYFLNKTIPTEKEQSTIP